MPFSAQSIRAARLHLQKSDPIMKGIVKRVGPFTAKAKRDRFLTLVRSIISQQISTAAANTIQNRLSESLSEQGITPESLLDLNVEQLRAIGISKQKAAYLHDLASKVASQSVDLKTIHRKKYAEVLSELTSIKGVGIWTSQMFMMFSLARLDILPVGDLGIQRAMSKFYAVDEELTSAQMEEIAAPWRPYATVASWYLWRMLEAVQNESEP